MNYLLGLTKRHCKNKIKSEAFLNFFLQRKYKSGNVTLKLESINGIFSFFYIELNIWKSTI